MNNKERLEELIMPCFDIDEDGYYCLNERQKDDIVQDIASQLVRNGVIIQRRGKWINDPPYHASNGRYLKAQECSVCHVLYISDGNMPYSNHPYCAECGVRMEATYDC